MISFTIPIRTQSLNRTLRLSKWPRAKQAKKQKGDVRLLCPRWTSGPLLLIRLTRVSPGELDGDNLQGALKAVRDAIASWLRVDDATPLIRWEYAQEKGVASIRVDVEVARPREVGTMRWPPLVEAER